MTTLACVCWGVGAQKVVVMWIVVVLGVLGCVGAQKVSMELARRTGSSTMGTSQAMSSSTAQATMFSGETVSSTAYASSTIDQSYQQPKLVSGMGSPVEVRRGGDSGRPDE